ncbi:MAG: AMP-binding protein, partial [Acidimicrobiia bacterium]
MTSTLEQTGSPDLSDAFPTVAWHIRQWAMTTPDRVAMRDKDFGVWQERTSAQLWDEVLAAAHALLALGVVPGEVTSIHSEDRPEWLIFDFATVAIRGITTGMYPTNP